MGKLIHRCSPMKKYTKPPPARTTRTKEELEAIQWQEALDSSFHKITIDSLADLRPFFVSSRGPNAAINAITNYLQDHNPHIEEWPEWKFKMVDYINEPHFMVICFMPFDDPDKNLLFKLAIR